ncbi:MAG: hypothetical protein CM1200mP41_37680 [Gammaproteobacteria bacterium]|nr:MAG: hypothetical protein CM1200mP41_37680 [Gammaproteobacteria bacterium]
MDGPLQDSPADPVARRYRDLSRVREAVGNDYDLMLDSMWSYTYDHAIKVGRAIEELNYFWYEDPLADDDLMGCMKLCEKLSIPLMATENFAGWFH